MMIKSKKIVPDTSILIRGRLSGLIETGKIKKVKIIIPKAVVDELQAQASRGKDIGFQGLEEIKRIRKVSKDKGIKIKFVGKRPTLEEIQLAKKGRIDALIRDVAGKEKATLLTSDYVQALVGEAENVKVEYVPLAPLPKKIKLEDFFSPQTQSVHLKVDVPPLAKKGLPGKVKLIKLRDKPCTEEELEEIIAQVMSKVRMDKDSFIEIGGHDSVVIQLGNYRISIARPPFSDGLEVTAVRPIVKVSLEDYKLHHELKKRLVEKSEGILIAGPPASGKTTFASSIAEFLSKIGKIVKTFEQPRDLQVGPEITEYAPLKGDWEKTAELLLLVRPDYTIFDELRKTKDFEVFSDMRLAGVGMIGVVHSEEAIDAIQRFIGRVELGMIPHIIDTVIYIRDGKIRKVYGLSLTVKIPTGMKEEDLVRPLIEIRDFESKNLEYEIYTYGEENVIVPVKIKASALKKLASQAIYQELKHWDPNLQVEIPTENRVVVRVRNEMIPRLIGKKGEVIQQIEKKLGVHISVEPIEATLKRTINWSFEETGSYFNLRVNPELTGEQVDIYKDKEFLFSATVGKSGQIKVRKKSDLGKNILQAIATRKLKVLV